MPTIDDNWHYTEGKTVYKIPYTKYEHYDTDNETEEEELLVLCEDCFETLLEILKERVDRNR